MIAISAITWYDKLRHARKRAQEEVLDMLLRDALETLGIIRRREE